MTINIGRLDQILRIGLSVLLIYFGFISDNAIQDPLSANIIGIMGTASLFVALIRFCPLYILTGINTCSNAGQ